MCIGIPARIERLLGGALALCSSRYGELEIDLALTGESTVGSWLLTFNGAARELITQEQAQLIDSALDALEAIAAGQGCDVDRFFPDLAGREPSLPPHLTPPK